MIPVSRRYMNPPKNSSSAVRKCFSIASDVYKKMTVGSRHLQISELKNKITVLGSCFETTGSQPHLIDALELRMKFVLISLLSYHSTARALEVYIIVDNID
jgi:hypothetical protein